MFDVTVMGEELTKKVGDTIDEIKYFLETIDNSLITYSSNIPKDDTEMTDAEKKRLPLLLKEIKEIQDKITSLYPDKDRIAALTKKINDLAVVVGTLVATIGSLQQELLTAIRNADAKRQTEINQQLIAYYGQLTSAQNEIATAHVELNAEANKKVDPQTLVKYMVQMANLTKEYNQIVYYRPGALPRALNSADVILKRINEVDQPKIEKILDEVPATVQEVNSVFKRFNVEEQPRIERIMDEVPGTVASVHDVLARVNAVEQPKVEDILDSVDDTIDDADQVLKQVHNQFVTVSFEPVDPSHLAPDLKGRLDDLIREQDMAVQRLQERQKIIGTAKGIARNSPAGIPVPGNSCTSSGNLSTGLQGASTQVIGGTYDNQYAYQKQLEREKLKIGREIERIRFRRVEKPGRIPQMLDSAHGSLEETRGILGKVNAMSGKVTDFAGKYSLFIKIGLGIAGVGVVLTTVLIPVLLIRMILFGL